MCAGGPERVAAAWSADRRAAIERAFAGTGSQNAARAFAGVASLVDQYVARWGGMYKETCEATHVRGEQSAEVLDLRMGCLGERLASVRALGDVFTGATAAVVDNAVTAAGALPTLDRCADVEMLKAVIKPPDDPAVRAKVAGIREEVAKVKALGDSGQCEKAVTLGISVTAEAKAVGYLPAEAESAFATGRLMDSCLDPAKGVALLHEAIAAAATSRHDELFVQATLVLGPMYADRFHDIARAEENVRHGRAVLARIPGHKLLEAWADEADAILAMRQGDGEHALQFERHAYQLRAELYGQDHYELTVALTNMGMDLHSLGRDAEAESVSRRAVDMSIRLFGPQSTPTAITLMNYSEILTALGRLNEAQSAAETSLSIWRQKQAGGFVVGYGLLDLGRVELARGEAAQAVATLQESLKMLNNQDASVVAEAKFALAKAFWAASPGTRLQAREFVRSARDLAAKEISTKRLLGQIEAWQAAHHDI
jgi:serine/threonine-protein kinase